MTRRSFDREAIEAEIDRVRSLGVDARCEDHNKSQSDEGWRRGLSSMTGAASDPAGLESANLDHEIAGLRGLDLEGLRARWRTVFRRHAPCHLPRHLLFRILAYRLQADRLGDLDTATRRLLDRIGSGSAEVGRVPAAITRSRTELRPGTLLVREWNGHPQRVMVLAEGFAWNGNTYRSLSEVAHAMTGTRWSGPRFFGVREKRPAEVRT
jgi:hypothetical protein